MNRRNGNMRNVKRAVRAVFPGIAPKPRPTTRASAGEKIIPRTTIRPTVRRRVLRMLEAKRFSSSRPLARAAVRTGTNALDSAFSANRSRKRLGIRNAALKASEAAPTPKRKAKICSRTRPRMRLSPVPTANERTPLAISAIRS
jgi:hypothetical protein